MTRYTMLLFVLLFMIAGALDHARALDGFSTCHAAGTTATSVSGIDTSNAKMVSVMTYAGAMEACRRNEEVSGAALKACADKLMKDGDSQIGDIIVWANCKKGTLTEQYSPVRESSYYTGPGSIHVTKWKFPVTPMCADDNDAAIAVFHTLCPSYEGKVENDD